MKESQMFEMDRKLQIAQKKYQKKMQYVRILEEMLKKGGTKILGLNIDDFIDEYALKIMKVK